MQNCRVFASRPEAFALLLVGGTQSLAFVVAPCSTGLGVPPVLRSVQALFEQFPRTHVVSIVPVTLVTLTGPIIGE